jgi:hypothetical protein
LLTFSALLLFGASLTIGSLHIVEAVVVSPELETVADAQLTPADTANESAPAIVRAIPASVLHVPQDPSIRTSVTTVRQSLPRSAPPRGHARWKGVDTSSRGHLCGGAHRRNRRNRDTCRIGPSARTSTQHTAAGP